MHCYRLLKSAWIPGLRRVNQWREVTFSPTATTMEATMPISVTSWLRGVSTKMGSITIATSINVRSLNQIKVFVSKASGGDESYPVFVIFLGK